ncbi:hypothetical protein MMC14_003611 [Varicellaria rhodocarpa]|nr:hypothetical protein [Varicellaria rhodocarpa]
MPSIPLLSPDPTRSSPFPNPLPQLLKTPSGLALLEIQGSINTPPPNPSSTSTHVGKLVFPLYNSSTPEDQAWMKKAYLYVGKYQRLTGEVQKLVKPIAIVRKNRSVGRASALNVSKMEGQGVRGEVLEIAEIIWWKVIFSNRPEPVGGEMEE